MAPELLWRLELAQVLISLAGLVVSGMVLRDAWRDDVDVRTVQVTRTGLVSRTAVRIARERLITAAFLFWIALFLFVVGVYSLLLIPQYILVTGTVKMSLQVQAYLLRGMWRISVFLFAFVRWSTRERIRRELHLEPL